MFLKEHPATDFFLWKTLLTSCLLTWIKTFSQPDLRNYIQWTSKQRWSCSSIIDILTLYCIMFQSGQTYFKNLAAFAARFLKCVWPFWDIMHGFLHRCLPLPLNVNLAILSALPRNLSIFKTMLYAQIYAGLIFQNNMQVLLKFLSCNRKIYFIGKINI